MKSINYIVLLLVLSLIFMFCDHGLAPPPKEAIEQGIEGKIYYKGNYPTNITAHKLFASKVYRTFRDMKEIMNLIFTTDSIALYPPDLPFTKIDSIDYRFVLQPDMYRYIAVAQARGEITDPANWKIVGVYSLDTLNWDPRPILVGSGLFIDSVNITVDYNNPPPQPFGN